MTKLLSEEKFIVWFILGHYEGWYGNDPDDAGEETFRGISRASHPEWHGWALIDVVKEKRDFEELIRKSQTLREYVLDFYIREYWNEMNLSALPIDVATEIFEQSINFGKTRAGRHLQISVNSMSYGIHKEIEEDGKIGSETVAATLVVCEAGRKVKLLRALNSLQGCRYIELMRRNPSQKKFIGWFNRVDYSLYEIIKKEWLKG